MRQETDLFGNPIDPVTETTPPLPSVRGSETSEAAAEEALPNAGTQRRRLWDFLEERGEKGATDEEMQEHLGMNPSTQRPRRVELVERGLVYDSGEKRDTRSGRKAVVWKARLR